MSRHTRPTGDELAGLSLIEPAAEPGRLKTLLAAVGVGIFKAIATCVIIAAGVGGWIAVERFAFAPAVGTIGAAPLAATSPWDPTLLAPAEPWTSYTNDQYRDGQLSERVFVDGGRGLSRLDYFANGAVTSTIETSGLSVWEQPLGGPWRQVLDLEVSRFHRDVAVLDAAPTHLADLLPPEAFRFTTVTEDISLVEGERRFVVTIDAASMRATFTTVAARWTELSNSVEVMVWFVDVRADGYVVGLDRGYGVLERWTPGPLIDVYSSPLAGARAPQPVFETPSTSTSWTSLRPPARIADLSVATLAG